MPDWLDSIVDSSSTVPWETLLIRLVVASEIEPMSATTVRHRAAMELSYRIRLLPKAKPTELIAELNQIEGIQTVELHSHRAGA